MWRNIRRMARAEGMDVFENQVKEDVVEYITRKSYGKASAEKGE